MILTEKPVEKGSDELWTPSFVQFELNMSSFRFLLEPALLDFTIQWVCWAVAAALKTEKFYDAAGSITFFTLSVLSLQWGQTFYPRQKIQTTLVAIWALRLGSYLSFRIMASGSDPRFNRVRDKPLKFFIYWTIQGIWVFVTLLPTFILNAAKKDKPYNIKDYLGWTFWIIGFLFESIADYQKLQFRNNPSNKGKFIRSGLWSISRHPNYFGEILLWFGLFLTASSVMEGAEYLSILSPAFVAFLLIKVSGIPLLEKSSFRKWGTSPAYVDYVQSTSILIPFIW